MKRGLLRDTDAGQRRAMTGLDEILDSIPASWELIRSSLRRDCGARTFDGWLRPIALGSFDPETATLRLQLASQFVADWVQTRVAGRLNMAWRATLPAVRQVKIGVGAAAPRTAALVEIP